MRQGPQTSIMGSPILIGAVTVLVSAVAVFLSYNANRGLPFVPTYKISVQVHDAAGLVKGNEVRIGGKRVGSIDEIDGKVGPNRAYARLDLKLDKPVEPLLDDSVVTVRPRSPLGLKYLEVKPGKRGRPIEEGGELTLARSVPTVELDEVFNTFDEATRKALQQTLDGLGTGLAGRGVAFNEAVAGAPELTDRSARVLRNLADPATRLRRAVRALERVTDELAPVAPSFGSMFDDANTTLEALASVRSELEQVLAETPPTEAAAIDTLRVARPLIADARLLLAELRPGVRALRTGAPALADALEVGTPVLKRTPPFNERLASLLTELETFAEDPLVPRGIRRLTDTVQTLNPTLQFLAPAQLTCNYVAHWFRNISSLLSEGDVNGTWQRFIIVATPAGPQNPNNEGGPSSHPADGPSRENHLHTNPYPNTAAPGQPRECEAGNEPYIAGRTVTSNVPGTQQAATEGKP